MPEVDRFTVERLHALIADKFKMWYATLGFSCKAHLDEGTMWATDLPNGDWIEDRHA